MSEQVSERDGAKVQKLVRDAIIRLELRPGSIIDEAGLAASLSVSRTPVREAMIQLIADGLVIRDGRSARVAPLDFDDVPKIYEALLVSSRMINRLAAENRTSAELAVIRRAMLAFEELVYEGDGLERQDVNFDFHMQIATAAHNRYFLEFYERAMIASSRLARACFSNTDRQNIADSRSDSELVLHVQETVRQHRAIVDAIADRDVEAADRLAVEHQELSFSRLKKALFSGADAITSLPDLAGRREMFSLT
ncbi:GntR family transcriptional regulator [Pseudorhizobium endolithicum]|uniref:GntR family transcriptional regulator n=1 Tax=Pseudorhizobium endolithicum TaxID=1191678 RepID=A0ABM8PM98_9HYPH|nr:GntR family transcriptional regulator [Pseudorhizobium endolithicum]CAD7037631.1 GntR family transcriptional regulator [Pseudorhizobium endolithicum]